MDSGPLAAILLLVLILLNGFLALSEISIVSARKGLLQSRASAGSKRDETALALSKAPGDFLSTIQVGITLVGILTGALGGATLAEDVAAWFTAWGLQPATSELISVILVVIATTYLSLILGELAPKQIGLIHSERVAAAVAPTIKALAWITRPVVWVLTKSTNLVVRLLGIRPSTEPVVTEEEIKLLIDQGTESGVFEKVEDAIVDQVFRMADLKTLSITIPRHEITWLDLNDPVEESYAKIRGSKYSHFPVADGDLDNLLGYVSSNDLLAQHLEGKRINLKAVMRPPSFVAENSRLFDALKNFRTSGEEIAFVIDEYGGVQGLITVQDILNALVEDLPGNTENQRSQIIERPDGSWLVDGTLSIQEFREHFSLALLAGEEEEAYHTVGGFVMSTLGEVPNEGDQFDIRGLHIEVLDMDRRRVDKVLISRPRGEDIE